MVDYSLKNANELTNEAIFNKIGKIFKKNSNADFGYSLSEEDIVRIFKLEDKLPEVKTDGITLELIVDIKDKLTTIFSIGADVYDDMDIPYIQSFIAGILSGYKLNQFNYLDINEFLYDPSETRLLGWLSDQFFIINNISIADIELDNLEHFESFKIFVSTLQLIYDRVIIMSEKLKTLKGVNKFKDILDSENIDESKLNQDLLKAKVFLTILNRFKNALENTTPSLAEFLNHFNVITEPKKEEETMTIKAQAKNAKTKNVATTNQSKVEKTKAPVKAAVDQVVDTPVQEPKKRVGRAKNTATESVKPQPQIEIIEEGETPMQAQSQITEAVNSAPCDDDAVKVTTKTADKTTVVEVTADTKAIISSEGDKTTVQVVDATPVETGKVEKIAEPVTPAKPLNDLEVALQRVKNGESAELVMKEFNEKATRRMVEATRQAEEAARQVFTKDQPAPMRPVIKIECDNMHIDLTRLEADPIKFHEMLGHISANMDNLYREIQVVASNDAQFAASSYKKLVDLYVDNARETIALNVMLEPTKENATFKINNLRKAVEGFKRIAMELENHNRSNVNGSMIDAQSILTAERNFQETLNGLEYRLENGFKTKEDERGFFEKVKDGIKYVFVDIIWKFIRTIFKKIWNFLFVWDEATLDYRAP